MAIEETTAAKVVSRAAEVAAVVVENATETAVDVLKAQSEYQQSDERNIKILSESLRKVFGENTDSKRFIDVTRIPLICQSIVDVHKSIDQINNNITWVVRVVISGIILALIALLIRK